MIVVMQPSCTEEEIQAVSNHIAQRGLSSQLNRGNERTVIGVVGQPFPELRDELEVLPGVLEAVPISIPYKLASRDFHPDNTVIRVGDVTIGGDEVVVMAGPCAVESEEQLITTARAIKTAGARILRGGAFKPRTSPYAFRGLAEEGLKILAQAREETGLPVITEVLGPEDVELVARYTDILQVGTRNMQNFTLLDEVGKARKPVMLKRGLSATYQEWLLAAEYILAGGNPQVILCERGIRTFETYTRNTMDTAAIPVVHKLSHLPIIADPSHGTGRWHLVTPIALASVAAGADGLMLEVHPAPDQAWSDGAQSLTPANFRLMMDQVRAIALGVKRVVAPPIN